NLAFVWYGISTTVEIPNDQDPSNPTTRTIESRNKAAFGYDLNASVDLNFANKFPVEIGVRHVQSFNVPQPLGEGSVQVSPSYLQFSLGVGANLDPPHHRHHEPKTSGDHEGT